MVDSRLRGNDIHRPTLQIAPSAALLIPTLLKTAGARHSIVAVARP